MRGTVGVQAGIGGEAHRNNRRVVSWPLLLALVLAVLGIRSYDVIVHPTMRVEDGAKVYAYFHDHRGLAHLFRFKSGYMPLLPNVVGYLSVRLPPQWAPYFLAVAPTLLSAFAYCSFFFRRFRSVVVDDDLRFVTCLALAIAPVGQYLLISHTDFSIWHALFCAVLWAWVPLPEAPWRAALALAGQQVFVWSHPISIVAAPLNAAHAWHQKGRGQRIAQGVMLAGHALHLVFGLDHSFTTRTVHSRLVALPMTFVRYEHRAISRALFGRRVVSWLLNHGQTWVPVAAAMLILAGALWVALRNVERLRLAVVLAVYSLTALAFAVAASRSGHQINHGSRYLYVQCLFSVMLIAFVVRAVWHAVRWPSALPRPWPGRSVLFGGVLIAGFGLQNLGQAHLFRDGTQGDNAQRVATCMQRLAKLHASKGGACGFSLSCPKADDDWAIVFHPPRCGGRRR